MRKRWNILAILCFDYLIMLCGTLYTYGAIVLPMAQELGMSMTQAALGQTLLSLSSAVISVLIGHMLAKNLSPKHCLLFAAISGMAGAFLMGFVTSGAGMYYLSFGFLHRRQPYLFCFS